MQNDSHGLSSRPSTSEDIAARIQSLRNILSSERHISAEQQVALDALDQEEADRLGVRAMERDSDPVPNSLPRTYTDEGYWESQSGPSTTSIARERRRPPRPSVRLDRQRDRLTRLGRSEPLEQVDAPPARLSPLHASRTRQASTDLDVEPQSTREGRYPKRRKLNDGTANKVQSLPDYGLTALHSPSNLKMKLLDSDIVNDVSRGTVDLDKLNIHSIDNKIILRTRLNQCNLLMKHQGGWPFDLSKLLVRLSKHEYDCSQLQGMVFVAMNGEDLLAKTAHYDSLVPPYHTFYRVRRYDSYRPSQDTSQRPRSPYRSVMRPRRMPEPSNPQWCDLRVSEDAMEVTQTEGYQVTVESVPEEEEDGLSTSPRSPRAWHDVDQEYSRRQYGAGADSYRPTYDDERSRRYYRTTAAVETRSRSSPTPSDSEDEDTLLYGRMSSARRDLEEAEERQRTLLDQLQAQRERRDFHRPYRPGRRTEDELRPMRENVDVFREFSVSSPGATLDLSSSDHMSRKRLPGPYEMLRGIAAYPDTCDGDAGKRILPHAKFQVTKDSGDVAIHFDPPV